MGQVEMQTLLFVWVTWNHFTLISGEWLCSGTPQSEFRGTVKDVWGSLGSSVQLNCTVLLSSNNSDCDTHPQWSKNGEPLFNFTQNTSQWLTSEGGVIANSILTVRLKEDVDFGLYTCEIWNSTTTFRLQSTFSPNHIGAMVASIVLFVVFVLTAVVYTKCHLNFKLWYKNSYGDYEMNDGKMFDAFISYMNDENDRKFVNFILKPHLENKLGHKLFLNDTNILPGAEPSAELLMNISRCRRLIVVLSQAYIEQEWCTTNFRRGLFHLLELSQKPIFILFQSQQKHVNVDIISQLRLHQTRITTLIWGAHSMTPSSGFWKELTLVMPHKVVFHSKSAGDPQTLLQSDKDPMLTLQPDYLDCRQDPDPEGDLGSQMPIYKVMSSRHPVLPAVTDPVIETKAPDIDVSDLGSRNYAARTDFYCLVTEYDL
ncbi:single Ig IL-1-related receptor [Trichomycterus rosablanca]|uniref:single Ig IL-1-related receptor n=1 Tax=Trichomycterus rosablanca TaxID=2290929 RepID=UPI002F353E3C